MAASAAHTTDPGQATSAPDLPRLVRGSVETDALAQATLPVLVVRAQNSAPPVPAGA